MRKIFTMPILATAICVSVCGCGGVPDSPKSVPAATEVIDENAGSKPVLLRVGDTYALRIAASTEDSQTETWAENYMALMMASCLNGDVETGRKAEADRNAKIAALNLEMPEISFDDLHELSKVITNEAGSHWLPMDWKMMVGEVVLNRVASVEFPNTVYEVIHQRGQYAGANRFKHLTPYESCVEAAARLLNGERLINNPSVVFQSNHRQGSGVYIDLYDRYLGHTYLCYSEHPELY